MAGNYIVSSVTSAIDGSDVVVAELSSMNDNVLFEFGYALAKNKKTIIAFDETDSRAEYTWKTIPALKAVGRVNYSGNHNTLAGQLATSISSDQPNLYESLLAGARNKEANAVFSVQSPVKHTAAEALEKYLQRQTHLNILGASDDLVIAPLDFYTKEIYRSSAAIFHLLGENRRRATEHNAMASLLAGFAHGLEIPILMAVEKEYQTPLDYADLLFSYETSAELQNKVELWLSRLPKDPSSQRRLGRLELDIELPIKTFGQYVAEYEREELIHYFVNTGEFAMVTSGEAKIFAGRKGTGKSATMSQVQNELNLDRGVLVVPIRPTAVELSGLMEVAEEFVGGSKSEYFLNSMWTYLIHSEIALVAIEDERAKPRPDALEKDLESLEVLLDHLGIDATKGFNARLEQMVSKVRSDASSNGNSLTDEVLARALRADGLARINELCSKILTGRRRVAVLIDNLDKNWEPSANRDSLSKLILALLVAAGRIERDIRASNTRNSDLGCTVAIFLRTDIMDAVKAGAREPDKISFRTVNWSDEELLARVLEERFQAKSSQPGPRMWEELFCLEVRGLPTRDYFMWRVLRRPRDFVYMANAALTTAINRKHRKIEAADIQYAETEYSRFAMEALVVESESAGLQLEEALYEFAGVDATLDSMALSDILEDSGKPDEMRAWLMASSFLGVETADDRFEYVEGEAAARRKIRVAERYSVNHSRPLRFRVHPAFRPYLEVMDDDLHETST